MIAIKYLTKYIKPEVMCSMLEDAFERAMQPALKKKDLQPVTLLRTYLDLADERLSFDQLVQSQDVLMRRVFGFIYSEAEAQLTPRAIYTLLNSLKKLIRRVYYDAGIEPPIFPHVTMSVCSDDTYLCIQEYQQLVINSDKYIYYIGWYVKTKDGQAIFLNLSAFHNVYGKEITNKIFSSVSDYIVKRVYTTATSEITYFSYILNILVSKYGSLHLLKDIGSAGNIDRLLEALFSIQLITISSNNNKVKNFYVTVWPKQLILIKVVFINTGIWSKPYFPEFKPKFLSSTTHSNTHKNISDPANKFNDKLITPVPLSYSDDEAIKTLLNNIQSDVDFVVSAFRKETKSIMNDYRKRKELALFGEVKACGDRLGYSMRTTDMTVDENICATWEYYKWDYEGTNLSSFLGGSISMFIDKFSLLTAHLLKPFIYLLIKCHNEITLSWLLNFKIYDEYGKKTGLVEVGDSWVATSYKKRKGVELAVQSIYLTEESLTLFENIIELTKDARAWLAMKKRPDNNYLLLSCNRGVSEPKRIKSVQGFRFNTVKVSRVGQTLSNWGREQSNDRTDSIINNLSLSSFRASCAVCVYLKTRSVKSMSEALGHTLYNPKLLSSYLPDPILRYFQSRWVRIFQNALVYESMKDSEFIFDAMDISEGELELFLTNHKLKPLPIHLVDGEVSDLEHEGLGVDCKVSVDAIIPVSISLLRLINAITELVDSARSGQIFSGFLEKWYETAVFIQKSIENEQCSEVIIEAMRESRLNPLPQEIIKKAIYGN